MAHPILIGDHLSQGCEAAGAFPAITFFTVALCSAPSRPRRLRSDAAFRGASGLDGACAQRLWQAFT